MIRLGCSDGRRVHGDDVDEEALPIELVRSDEW